MKVTVEELKRLEKQDIRELRREDLDNVGDIVVDRSVPANKRMMEFLEKTKTLTLRMSGIISSKSHTQRIQRKHWKIR